MTSRSRFHEWAPAFKWGIGVALAHRLLLAAWMAAVWILLDLQQVLPVDSHNPAGDLPTLQSPAAQLLFGVWRRWDAVHYMNLAQYGYRASDPGPTVFGPLTPLGLHLFDRVLPGPIDLGAMVFATLAFGLGLVFLYRLCQTYYGDTELAPWAVVVTAALPLSYYYQAPMSEGIYLAMTLGLFFASSQGYWRTAALFGFLATLARPQGALLAGVAGLMLVEEICQHHLAWGDRLAAALKRGWPLAFIPLGVVVFELFRHSRGLPPTSQVYAEQSYVFLVNPIQGLAINLKRIIDYPLQALRSPDLVALGVCLLLCIALPLTRRHQRLPLIAYAWGYLLVFTSKINWQWGTHTLFYTQSLARYSLMLFPLAVLLADGIRRAPAWGRLLSIGSLQGGLLAFSAMYALGGGPF